MISQLASPSVCVIDDDEEDYKPILFALNSLFVSSAWISGSIDSLPPQPFTRVQLVFLDLHLTNSLGKDAASHTANVFTKVVSASTAPVVVVIWSKYAQDKVAADGVPPEDQETEAETFKRTLFEAEPRFKNRLVFLEMDKPKKDDRPADWIERLRQEIENTLGKQSAIELLWAWDGLVKDSNAALMASLTDLAEESAGDTDPELTDADMKEVLQRLTKAHSDGDLTAATAPSNLVAVLSHLLADQLEHARGETILSAHGAWLSQAPGSKTKASVAGKMNGFLLTSAVSDGAPAYMPGTVYRATDSAEFYRVFGVTAEMLEKTFCNKQRQGNPARVDEWNAAVKPIVLEISPVCDVANGKRFHALLLGGLVVPAEKKVDLVGRSEAIFSLPGSPSISLRWPLDGFNSDETVLVLSHRLRVSMNVESMPAWLMPWFRLRELPTTALRNSHMANASRVGLVTVI